MSGEYVGKHVLRSGVYEKVTGQQRYIRDRKVPGMLYARLLRSPWGSADIVSVDTENALQCQGIFAVLTAADMEDPMPRFGSVVPDQPLLASGNVKFYGEPVAVVLAESEDAAREAAGKIKVQYRPRKAITTIEEALAPDAPAVNPDPPYPARSNGGKNDEKKPHANILDQFEYGWGDVNAARKNAARVFEGRYSFPMVYHFSLENYGCLAVPEEGALTVHTPIQHPFILRRVLAQTLNMPQSRIRVAAEEIGGGFGGKGYPKIEPLAGYLALRFKRPVKIDLDFDEGFYLARRLASTAAIQTGFDENGIILFQDINVDYLIGPYASEGSRIAQKAAYVACGAYKTPNARITARVIQSNTSPSTAFRGFGMPQLIWALERNLDKAAAELGADRVEIRQKNLPRKGEVLIPNDTPADGDWNEGLLKAAEMIGFHTPSVPGQGRGIAIGIKNPIPSSRSNAVVRMLADGSANVYVGTTEMGQGSRTVMAQIAAEVLGTPLEKIRVHMGDTLTVPFDQATAGSRSTVSMGSAVRNACLHVNEQIKNCALDYFKKNDVKLSGGKIFSQGREIPYEDFFLRYFGPFQADVVGLGVFNGVKDAQAALGGKTDFWEVVFTAVDLFADKVTGEIRINKIVNVTDAGKVINPLLAESQEKGGTVIALGHTFMEQMIYDEYGRLLNADPLNYCIPTSKDVPLHIESGFVENGDGSGPFGAKGLGESSVIALAAAVGNALQDAAGVSFESLPITREKLFFKLNFSS